MNILMASGLKGLVGKAVTFVGTTVATFIPSNQATNEQLAEMMIFKDIDKTLVVVPYVSKDLAKELKSIEFKDARQKLEGGDGPDTIPASDRFKFNNQTAEMLAYRNTNSGDIAKFEAYNKFVKENPNSEIVKIAKRMISGNPTQDILYQVARIIGTYKNDPSFSLTVLGGVFKDYMPQLHSIKKLPNKQVCKALMRLYLAIGGDETDSCFTHFKGRYEDESKKKKKKPQAIASTTPKEKTDQMSDDDLFADFTSDDVEQSEKAKIKAKKERIESEKARIESEKKLADAQKKLEEAVKFKNQSRDKLIKALKEYVATGGNPADFDWYDEIAKKYNITPDDL